MNSTSSPDCDTPAASKGLLTVDEALQRIFAQVTPVIGVERMAIPNALGRITATDVISPINVPGHVNSAMDGYAFRHDDFANGIDTTLRVVGTAFAGRPFEGHLGAGEAVRIMTGAVVPDGADTVEMQENIERTADDIRFLSPPRPGANVRQIGEDLAIGQTVLAAGRRLRPADLGLLASLGVGEVSVYRRLRVAFFSTGDELCSLGESLAEGQIYDSNRYTLQAMLQRLDTEIINMGVIRDDRGAIEAAFADAAACADVVITSGGVSVGEADFVTETLNRIGNMNFWKIAMKPGKPLTFGAIGNAWFFGLPGNPVSAMATFYQIVQPALRRLAGEQTAPFLRLRVPAAEPFKKRPGRQDYQRGILFKTETGEIAVRSTGPQGSHILRSMSEANCFIVLPAESGRVEAGTLVEVQPFEGLLL